MRSNSNNKRHEHQCESIVANVDSTSYKLIVVVVGLSLVGLLAVY